jgi:hypothetical protein
VGVTRIRRLERGMDINHLLLDGSAPFYVLQRPPGYLIAMDVGHRAVLPCSTVRSIWTVKQMAVLMSFMEINALEIVLFYK